MEEYILEMKNITKRFPGVKALSNVTFNLKAGEVHVLMGENGAGKSTLMKILAGVYRCDEGAILLEGEKMEFSGPRDAIDAGIAMVHQELNNIQDMTIAENIFLGRELRSNKSKMLDIKQMNRETETLFPQLDIHLNPKIKVRSLSTSNQQLIEIAKAVSTNAKIIIMDEPTSSLTEKEVEHLFSVINRLKEKGVAIVYISHKMDEIKRIADRITIFRDGELIASRPANEFDNNSLVSLMVGRELLEVFPKLDANITDVMLRVEDLEIKGHVKQISFDVHKGEILGFAGLVGAGRTELMEGIFGERQITLGRIIVDGREVKIKIPKDAVRAGIAMVSEDRKMKGINPIGTVCHNISIASLNKFCRCGFVNCKHEKAKILESINKLGIKTPSYLQIIRNLSGGNQQKAIIAKWLLTEPKVIILDEPTRGIDVGAKAEIHALISALAQQGLAVIMVSSELPEIIGMCDRIIVLHEGEKTGEIRRNEFDQKLIMNYATGIKKGA